MHRPICAGILLATTVVSQAGASGVPAAESRAFSVDSDHDGLSDGLESALLAKYAPTFMISSDDCSERPAHFAPGDEQPTVTDEDGTIYGQVFPRAGHAGEVELHYYHLWRRDCGEMGHPLDAEHVSALVQLDPAGSPGAGAAATSTALYWYAAAHEDTVCDASQLTRASTIHAEEHGALAWLSAGKHASFLSETLCTHGCGGDRCDDMVRLQTRQIINLGEMHAPMNGITWLASPEWPLSDKLQRTDFTAARMARLGRLPDTTIAWANPAKRPAQAAILGANAGIGGAALGARSTDAALTLADTDTDSALGRARTDTSHALGRSSASVWHALKKSVQKTGDALSGN